MEFTDISSWLDFAKTTVDTFKTTAGLLPKGKNRDEIEKSILVAEESLKRSDAKLAKELGFKLCVCTFPPQIMLWKEVEKSHVCPSPHCGRKLKPGMQISPEAAERLSKPTKPNGWMGR